MKRLRVSGLRLVVLCTLAVGLVIGIFTYLRWNDWNYGYDLGIFAQVVDNVPHGFVDQPEFGTHFRFHFAPILALLWPAMAIFRSPLVLQWAAIGLTCATSPLVYILFRRYADAQTCTWIALCSLFNPFLYSQAFNEFHELCFLPFLAIGLVWALDRARWSIAIAFGLLAFCVREDAALTTVVALVCFCAIGVCNMRRGGPSPRGLLLGEPERPGQLALVSGVLAALGIVILSSYFVYAKAHLGGWEPATFYQYSFATSPLAVVVALFAQPLVAWPQLLTLGRIGYLAEALLCMGFLPLRSRWIVLAVPGLAVVLLANSIGVWRIGAQYALLWIPWLIVAFGEAALSLSARTRQRWFIACACVLAILSLVGNPLHVGTYLRPSYHDLASARLALASIGNVSLSTHDEFQAQISISDPLANSEFSPNSQWFVYADDFPNERFQTVIKSELADLLRRGAIRVVHRFGDVAVYRRNAGP